MSRRSPLTRERPRGEAGARRPSPEKAAFRTAPCARKSARGAPSSAPREARRAAPPPAPRRPTSRRPAPRPAAALPPSAPGAAAGARPELPPAPGAGAGRAARPAQAPLPANAPWQRPRGRRRPPRSLPPAPPTAGGEPRPRSAPRRLGTGSPRRSQRERLDAGRPTRPSPFPPSFRGKQPHAPHPALPLPPHARSVSGCHTTPVRRVGRSNRGEPLPTCARPARPARPSPARAYVRRAGRFVPQPAVGSCSRGRGGAWAAAQCRRLPATLRGKLSRRPRRLRTMGPGVGREGRGEKQGGRCAAPLRSAAA